MEISSAGAMTIGTNSLLQSQQDLAQTSHDIASKSAGIAPESSQIQSIEGQPLNQGASTPPASAPSAVQAQTAEHQPLTQDLIQMKVEQHQAQSAAKVIRTADEVIGSLIDIRA